jgi:aspartate/methionine/tyrosine aminotransferase
LDFARKLLKDVRVAVVPGEAFGRDYSGFIRISYASPFQDLKEAASRLKRFNEK